MLFGSAGSCLRSVDGGGLRGVRGGTGPLGALNGQAGGQGSVTTGSETVCFEGVARTACLRGLSLCPSIFERPPRPVGPPRLSRVLETAIEQAWARQTRTGTSRCGAGREQVRGGQNHLRGACSHLWGDGCPWSGRPSGEGTFELPWLGLRSKRRRR